MSGANDALKALFLALPLVISEDSCFRCFIYFKGGVLIALIDCRGEGNKVLLSCSSVISLLPFLFYSLSRTPPRLLSSNNDEPPVAAFFSFLVAFLPREMQRIVPRRVYSRSQRRSCATLGAWQIGVFLPPETANLFRGLVIKLTFENLI